MIERVHGLHFRNEILDDAWLRECVGFEDLDRDGEKFAHRRGPHAFSHDAEAPVAELHGQRHVLVLNETREDSGRLERLFARLFAALGAAWLDFRYEHLFPLGSALFLHSVEQPSHRWLAQSYFLQILGLYVVKVVQTGDLQVVPDAGEKLRQLDVAQELLQPLGSLLLGHFCSLCPPGDAVKVRQLPTFSLFF